MSEGKPLDDLYLEWLYKSIGAVSNRNPDRSHWLLATELYKTRFIYFVPNDENRALDGLELREQFLNQLPASRWDDIWFSMDCSMLEMLIALAKRADFETDSGALPGGVGGWFWKLMENVNLNHYTDSIITNRGLEVIQATLYTINERTYRPNGKGGLFPLRRPKGDQTKIELWYQLSAYLLENKYVRT